MNDLELRIAQENEVTAKFLEQVELLADSAIPMWRYSDGNGGFVFEALIKAFNARGLIVNSKAELKEKKYTKKVISPKLRLKVYARDQYMCKVCKTSKDLTVDHIFPESKGGTLDFDNLQTLCKSHNSSKGAKIFL